MKFVSSRSGMHENKNEMVFTCRLTKVFSTGSRQATTKKVFPSDLTSENRGGGGGGLHPGAGTDNNISI